MLRHTEVIAVPKEHSLLLSIIKERKRVILLVATEVSYAFLKLQAIYTKNFQSLFNIFSPLVFVGFAIFCPFWGLFASTIF